MTSRSLSSTLAGDRPAVLRLLGILGFAAALAAASQVSIPLPGTPVPITLQPMLVVLAGLWLGPAAGGASMMLFLVAGMSGLPVFTPGGAPGVARLLGPTGGYLIAYPVAAYLVGRLARRGSAYGRRLGAALAGMAVIYAGGLAQLAILTGSVESAVLLGLAPFVALDVVKASVAAILEPRRI